MSRTAAVVIIGGGVTGASIAFHLAARGVRDVLLLERHALASGGTGRSVGIVRQLYPTPETTQMVVRSLRVDSVRREPQEQGRSSRMNVGCWPHRYARSA